MLYQKVRNGKIELLRFVFCLCIVCFHINIDLWNGNKNIGEFFSFFSEGRIGVEFFFLVSGYLLASSAFKLQESKDITIDTFRFMSKKLLIIFPIHLVAFFLTYFVIIIGKDLSFTESLIELINALPNLFLIHKIGIYSVNVFKVEWYITTMLIGSFILYPIILKYYKVFSRIIAPILGLILVGIMVKQSGYLSGINEWMFGSTIIKSQLRAVAELCLGIFSFELTRYISKADLTKKDKIFLTFIELSMYTITFLYAVSQFGRRYQVYILFVVFIGVSLSFSNLTYGNNIFNKKIIFFLGKMSLPIYLCQDIMRNFTAYFLSDLTNVLKAICILIGTILIAFPVQKLADHIKNVFLKKMEKINMIS